MRALWKRIVSLLPTPRQFGTLVWESYIGRSGRVSHRNIIPALFIVICAK